MKKKSLKGRLLGSNRTYKEFIAELDADTYQKRVSAHRSASKIPLHLQLRLDAPPVIKAKCWPFSS